MILRWKIVSSTERVAQWQGHHLSLRYEPATPPWRLYVDGRFITHVFLGGPFAAWWTDKAAMEAVEGVVNKLIKEMGMEAKAVQRELTPLFLVKGGSSRGAHRHQ